MCADLEETVTQPWQLPGHVADILPTAARQLKSVRGQVLELFRVYGCESMQSPLIEYSGSLLIHIDEGLLLKTIRVADQISGRQLGIRADTTSQVARVDAHLLSANEGINRLRYAGSVFHARPDGLFNTREPLQVGAELYGFAGVVADIELTDLMLKSMEIADIGGVLLSLGHIGVFRVLARAADLDEARAARLLPLMQDRDAPVVSEQVAAWRLDGMWARALALLPTLYGGRKILARARAELPDLNAVGETLDELEAVCKALPSQQVHVDLSELRVDKYHTGLLFTAYGSNCREVVARGGHCDGLDAYFGRSCPATGFSFDMRVLVDRLPAIKRLPLATVAHEDAEGAEEAIGRSRVQGQRVVVDYGVGYDGSRDVSDRLKKMESGWEVFRI